MERGPGYVSTNPCYNLSSTFKPDILLLVFFVIIVEKKKKNTGEVKELIRKKGSHQEHFLARVLDLLHLSTYPAMWLPLLSLLFLVYLRLWQAVTADMECHVCYSSACPFLPAHVSDKSISKILRLIP